MQLVGLLNYMWLTWAESQEGCPVWLLNTEPGIIPEHQSMAHKKKEIETWTIWSGLRTILTINGQMINRPLNICAMPTSSQYFTFLLTGFSFSVKLKYRYQLQEEA